MKYIDPKLPTTNHVLLELHVLDFVAVKDFYGRLGFVPIWERAPDGFKGYLIMQKDDNILCFWPGTEKAYEHEYFAQWPRDAKRGLGVEIVIMVENVDAYYKQVRQFAKVVEELKMKPWGLKDFRVEDPFGYYLRFTTHHNILSNDYAVK